MTNISTTTITNISLSTTSSTKNTTTKNKQQHHQQQQQQGVKYLVEAGADIGIIVSGNLTTLHICAENGLAAAVTAILQTETGL